MMSRYLLFILLFLTLCISDNHMELSAESTNNRGDFGLLWSSDIGMYGGNSIALLHNGTMYDIVVGNGTYIAVLNSTGGIVESFDVISYIDSSIHVYDYGFGFLGSNLSHVYTTVVTLEQFVSLSGDGYYVYLHILFIGSSENSATSPVKISKSIRFAPRPPPYIDLRIGNNPTPTLSMTPTLRSYFGNASLPLFSGIYEDNGVHMTLIDEDGNFVNIGSYPESCSYTSNPYLTYLSGNQLVMALRNISGYDYVLLYPIYQNSSGSIFVDYSKCVIGENISYSGDVPDVVIGDMDGDGYDEVVVDNSTGLAGLREDNNTQSNGYLSGDFVINCGIADYVLIGNFSGDEKPEAIFYDPLNRELEVWNTKDPIFTLSINGSSIKDMELCDLDGDGYVDVFLLTDSYAYFIYNVSSWDSLLLTAEPTSNGILADINGDGFLEMIFVANTTMYCYSTPYNGIGNKQLLDELASRTLKIDGDTDGDGLTDQLELYVYGTSPYLVDTDGDGISDDEDFIQEPEHIGDYEDNDQKEIINEATIVEDEKDFLLTMSYIMKIAASVNFLAVSLSSAVLGSLLYKEKENKTKLRTHSVYRRSPLY